MKRVFGLSAFVILAMTAATAQTIRRAEDDFVAIMLQHHRDGIEMARVAEEKATTAELRALARRIRQTQEGELREMKQFARSTPAPVGTTGQQPGTGHGQDHYTNTEDLNKGLARVRSATGKEVDVAFLNEMARHRGMAQQLARETRFETQGLKQAAERMTASLRKEIAELKRALSGLSRTSGN